MLNLLDVSAVNLKTRHKSSVVAQNAETCMISELYMSNIPLRKRAAGAFVHTGNKNILEIETNKYKQTNNNNNIKRTYSIMKKKTLKVEREQITATSHIYIDTEEGCARLHILTG